MVYKSYLIRVNNISIVEIGETCGILYLVCKKKDCTCILDVSWCSGNSEDIFSHDMAHIISLFPCLKINITFNKVS